jgi:hypothetical protein
MNSHEKSDEPANGQQALKRRLFGRLFYSGQKTATHLKKLFDDEYHL